MNRFCYLFALMALIWSGCENPFQTREVEEPVNARSNREIPSDPETVLRNLQSAIADKNETNYMACLTSNTLKFQFTPDPVAKEFNPSVFLNWGLESERNYVNQIRNYVPIDSASQLIFEDISNEVYADSALLRRKYTLILKHTYQGNVPREVTGQAYFWIFKEAGYWFIHRWIDYGTSGEPSWSTIKAGFGK